MSDSDHLVQALRRAYRLMLRHQGHQRWWPAETSFEVCVGAILTQNTAWSNVRRAMDQLAQAELLEPRKLLAVPEDRLARLVRPAGYYNVKAKRLRSFLQVLVEEYDADLALLFHGETGVVRARLLAIHGIGPETADSMLLYAGNHLSFVVDAYAKRIFLRHGWLEETAGYAELQALCSRSLNQLPRRALLDYWQDYHAQLVAVGNAYCRTRNPRCEICPLRSLLPQPAFSEVSE